MQFLSLLSALLLIMAVLKSDGYGHQQIPLQQNIMPHAVYGPPPPVPPVSARCTDHTSAPVGTQVPILAAVARTPSPSGINYEVKLSQSNRINLVHAQPPQHATIRGPTSYYTNNYPPVSTSVGSSQQMIPAQQRPYHQALHGVHEQQYGNGAAGSHVSYASHQNPLLTPQLMQRSPPPPTQSQSFSHLSNQREQQPFAGSPLRAQPSNSANVDVNKGVPGNYISQSEVGQLDHYFEKQNPVGDTRAYTRLITTCHPDGHCEQQQLSAGEVDQRHQHVVLTARARVQPISDKCRALSSSGAIAPLTAGSVSVGSAAQISMKRPPNRRRYPYTEEVIARDPFN